MSSIGRMQDSLLEAWWGYEDGSGNWTDGSLHDLGADRIGALVNETIDLLLALGWSQRPKVP